MYALFLCKTSTMRKILLNLAVTLDGYIEGPNGEYDWCFTDQDYGMSDFFKRTRSTTTTIPALPDSLFWRFRT